MLNVQPKQIVLTNYPFTDQAAAKLRPCLIIAKSNNFVWAIPITKIDSRGNYDNFVYQLSPSDTTSKLNFDSCLRCNVVMTIDINTITKHITTVNNDAYERIHAIVSTVFNTGKP